ncbi:MAG: hypothetical protein R3F62_15805 [Planctomycetota bacterium]
MFVGEGGKVYLRRDGPNERLAERFGYRQLGFFHRWHSGLLRWGPQTPAELGVFAREAARARRQAPACPYLPPPPE